MRTVLVIGLLAALGLWVCANADQVGDVHTFESHHAEGDYVPPRVDTVGKLLTQPTIATCDPQKLLTKYKKAQDDLVALDKQTQQARQQVVAQTQQIEAKRKELKGLKKRDDREQAAKELGAMVANLKNFQETQGKELTDKRNELLVSIDEDLLAAVQKIAKQKGVNLVLTHRRSSVLYADDALDITDDVIELLNKGVE